MFVAMPPKRSAVVVSVASQPAVAPPREPAVVIVRNPDERQPVAPPRETLQPPVEPVAPPREIAVVSVANERNRVDIVFPEKPDATTRASIKKQGFRWKPAIGWYNRRTDANILAANQIVSAYNASR